MAEAIARPTKRTLKPHQILAAFDDEIEPIRPTFTYRLSVLLVAGVMLLLPVIYVTLVGLVICGVGYHAVNHVGVFEHVGKGSGSARGAFLVYVGPIVAGSIVVAFMLEAALRGGRPAEDKRRAGSRPPGRAALVCLRGRRALHVCRRALGRAGSRWIIR